jgi:hypothetical protein
MVKSVLVKEVIDGVVVENRRFVRCDGWADLLQSSRRLTFFELVRWRFLKRKYGASVVLKQWHCKSLRGERVKVRDEYTRLQVLRWGRLMGRILVHTWLYDVLGDFNLKNRVARQHASVSIVLALADAETRHRVSEDASVLSREQWKSNVPFEEAPPAVLYRKVCPPPPSTKSSRCRS